MKAYQVPNTEYQQFSPEGIRYSKAYYTKKFRHNDIISAMVIEREDNPEGSRIETAAVDQVDEIADFMQPVYADTYPNGTTIRRDMFENDVFHKHLKDYLAQKLTNPLDLLLLARSNGQIVGTIGLEVDGSDPEVAEMWGFYVAPNLQGRGFGRVLYDALMANERTTALNRIHLNVAKRSERAISFYKTRGFSITGEEQWNWPSWTNEHPTNQYWIMGKELAKKF